MREGVSPMPPGAMNYAGFWIRFVAKFIDGIILARRAELRHSVRAWHGHLGDGGARSNPNPEMPAPPRSALTSPSMVIGIGIQVLANNGLLVAKYWCDLGQDGAGAEDRE